MKKDELSNFGFEHSHNIVMNSEGVLGIQRIPKFRDKGEASIYLWLIPKDGEIFTVLYCGKAGYGPSRRMAQHAGGWRQPSTGKANQDLIREVLEKSNAEIQVFARTADRVSLFGVKVPLYSTEEEAFCEAFSPLWNRATFPSSKKSQKIPGQSRKYFSNLDISVDDLPHGDEVKAYRDTLNVEQKCNFLGLIQVLTDYLVGNGIEQKIIRGYSNQPTGYNNIPMLNFCRRTPMGKAERNGWYARVPMPENDKYPFKVFLNKTTIATDFDASLFNVEGRYYIPKDINDLINDPKKYIKCLSH